MAGRIKLSFQHRVLIALLALCWALVAAFLFFQYQREKMFRFELFNTALQTHNSRIIELLSEGESIDSAMRHARTPVAGLRMTLIEKNGFVIYDNNDRTPFPVSNHNDRPEVVAARKNGVGYSVDRRSKSDETDYFYSAKLGDNGIVVRSAAPYNHSLRDFLKADSTFLWIMLTVTVIVSFAGYIITRRISTSITHLKNFAEKAGNGEHIYNDWDFPDDELGNIAGNIVKLYVQRDREHQEAISQERDKIRLKKQLTNNISHELKTPVAAIRICAELLHDHPELPEVRRKEFVRRICSNTYRLDALMNDVASITRIDDGRDVITMENVDVKSLVEETVNSIRPLTSIRIITDIQPLNVNGNRSLLDSIFNNLIDNSIAYSGATEISIIADSNGNFIFRDNGTGIPEEHLPHIFERFYRIDKGRSREKGGTGLGLSIVKNVVAIHGGSIKASNDNGLRFDFNIMPSYAT